MDATADASQSHSSLSISEEVAASNEPIPSTSTSTSSEITATAVANGTTNGDDASEKGLKKAWLKFLPIERVIEIVLKLDEHVPVEVKREVWPSDLKTTVFNAAVAAILESSNKGKAIDLSSLVMSQTPEGNADPNGRDASPSTDVDDTPPIGTASAPAPPTSVVTTSTIAPTTPAPPVSGTAPYGSSYPLSFNHNHPLHQTHPYVFSVPPTSGPTPYAPPPPTGLGGGTHLRDGIDEDDLPSYEEMLVQALTSHNNPNGTAPKQLFQWMAVHYPLQANFRPSASQALQKAYKRGRLEKNKDGKYRLNPNWEGGMTAKRTTRRPQSYAKAVTNPSPSSHQPENLTYPSYLWQAAHPPSHQEAAKTVTTTTTVQPAETGISDAENHRDAWEAAQSILQALNLGAILNNSASENAKQTEETPGNSGDDVPIDPSLLAEGGKTTVSAVSTSDSAQVPPPSDDSILGPTVSEPITDRISLQRSLALLAAQLADLATEDGAGADSVLPTGLPALASSEWPTLSEAVTLSVGDEG